MRFQISYGRIAPLLVLLGIPKRQAFVEVGDVMLTISMGWSFQADVARDSIKSIELHDKKHLSIGVHGWRGKWLVNGKAGDFVRLEIEPPTSAKVGPMPVRLNELIVSLEDPEGFVAALT